MKQLNPYCHDLVIRFFRKRRCAHLYSTKLLRGIELGMIKILKSLHVKRGFLANKLDYPEDEVHNILHVDWLNNATKCISH
jgi:hypothetical protein